MSEVILISIRPTYVKRIFFGDKKYEYRRSIPAKSVYSLLVYASAPVKKIIGTVEVLETLSLPPEELWGKTKDHAGMTKESFDRYFKGKTLAHAFVLGKTKRFTNPKLLSTYGINHAPQSFIYIY